MDSDYSLENSRWLRLSSRCIGMAASILMIITYCIQPPRILAGQPCNPPS